MENNEITYFLLGLGAGVAATLLFAPLSGKETRHLLKEQADKSGERLKQRTTELRDAAADVIDRGKRALDDSIDSTKVAIKEARDHVTAS